MSEKETFYLGPWTSVLSHLERIWSEAAIAIIGNDLAFLDIDKKTRTANGLFLTNAKTFTNSSFLQRFISKPCLWNTLIVDLGRQVNIMYQKGFVPLGLSPDNLVLVEKGSHPTDEIHFVLINLTLVPLTDSVCIVSSTFFDYPTDRRHSFVFTSPEVPLLVKATLPFRFAAKPHIVACLGLLVKSLWSKVAHQFPVIASCVCCGLRTHNGIYEHVEEFLSHTQDLVPNKRDYRWEMIGEMPHELV